jgi:hypothetical protein
MYRTIQKKERESPPQSPETNLLSSTSNLEATTESTLRQTSAGSTNTIMNMNMNLNNSESYSEGSPTKNLYYNKERQEYDRDDENGVEEDESRGIMNGSSSPSSSSSPSLSRHDRHEEMKELKHQIQYWNKFLFYSNSSVVLFAISVIVLYFTTDIFPSSNDDYNNNNNNGNKNITSANCLNETMMLENDMETFLSCAGFCSNSNICPDIDTSSFTDETKELLAIKSTKRSDTDKDTNTDTDTTTITPVVDCDTVCPSILTNYLEYFTTYMDDVCDREKMEVDNDNDNTNTNTDNNANTKTNTEQFKLCQKKCKNLECCYSMDDDVSCLEDNGFMCGLFFDTCLVVHENPAMFGMGLGPQILDKGG